MSAREALAACRTALAMIGEGTAEEHTKRLVAAALGAMAASGTQAKTGADRTREYRFRLGLRAPEWAVLRRLVLRRDQHICRYCGKPATAVDHVRPLLCGGTNDVANLVAACMACNAGKSGRTPEQAGMVLR